MGIVSEVETESRRDRLLALCRLGEVEVSLRVSCARERKSVSYLGSARARGGACRASCTRGGPPLRTFQSMLACGLVLVCFFQLEFAWDSRRVC